MKNKKAMFWLPVLVVAFGLTGKNTLSATSLNSCRPAVLRVDGIILQTTPATDITYNSAMCGGDISSDGGDPVTARGVCWDTLPNPVVDPINLNYSRAGSGIGNFTCRVFGLNPNTTYYARAYATNSAGTTYGEEISFVTLTSLSTIYTTPASGITTSSAITGGNIYDNGGTPVTAHGVCWSTSPGPVIDPATSNFTSMGPAGVGAFSSQIANLLDNTTYYVRAYATNGLGTAYGNQISFTTARNTTPPRLSTAPVTNITVSSATGGGNILSDGGDPVTARGVCWDISPNPVADPIKRNFSNASPGIGTFSSPVLSLQANTTYYVRAFATNGAGTAYGNEVSFATLSTLATVSTMPVSAITASSASSGGNIYGNGGTPVTAHGVCWGTSQGPVINPATNNFTNLGSAGAGTFNSQIASLQASTIYYLRAYATNSAGTAYGNQISFMTARNITLATLGTTPVTDITPSSAIGGGNVSSDGGDPVTNRGVCWDFSPNPVVDVMKRNFSNAGPGMGIFSIPIYGLQANRTYYLRAFATNGGGTAYGNEVSFVTPSAFVTLSTVPVSAITNSSAIGSGNIFNNGGTPVTDHGVCWSTSPGPVIDPATNNFTNLGPADIGTFSSQITGLQGNTTYYVRSYAINGAGTAYGNEISFMTARDITPATLSTTPVTDITAGFATGGGDISSDGGDPITARGVCWDISPNPVADPVKRNFSNAIPGIGAFSSPVFGLQANTTYYVRAFATNGGGTAYGNEVSFETPGALAMVSTMPISGITVSSATGNGNIYDNGGTPVTAHGVCWSTSPGPVIDPATNNFTNQGPADIGAFSSQIAGLQDNTTYYVRTYVTNEAGMTYGNEISFMTARNITQATLGTTPVTDITFNAATGGGNISSDGGDPIIDRGVCWDTSPNPVVDPIKRNFSNASPGIGTFTSPVFGLQANTTYYVRAFATNGGGTAYGDEVSFATPTALATLSTTPVSGITASSATSGGNISSNGGYPVMARGVCWGTSPDPVIDPATNNFTTDGQGIGIYNSQITGLKRSTTYYIRAYATSSGGTAYGNTLTIKTARK